MAWLFAPLVIAFVGFGLFAFARQLGRLRHTPGQAAQLISDVLRGTADEVLWDRFLAVRAIDPRVEQVRRECLAIRELHGTAARSMPGLTEEGQEQLEGLAAGLRELESSPV